MMQPMLIIIMLVGVSTRRAQVDDDCECGVHDDVCTCGFVHDVLNDNMWSETTC